MIGFLIFLLIVVVLVLYFAFRIFPLIVLLIGSPNLRLFRRKRELAKSERRESLDEGGIEEAHPYRGLTAEEKDFLRFEYQNSRVVFDNWWWLLPFFVVTDSLLIYFYSKGCINLSSADSFGSARSCAKAIEFIIVYLGLQVGIVFWSLSHWNTYLDLISPVFKIQGQAIKEIRKVKKSEHYFITVRKKTFSERQFFQLRTFFKSVKDGAEVAVEYSPRTKHVWKMYKTEDLK